MCELTTAAVIAAVMASASAGQTAIGYEQQRKAAKEQEKAVNRGAMQNYKQAAQQRLQERESLSRQEVEQQRQIQLARGATSTASAASGAGGASMDLAGMDLMSQAHRNLMALRRQQQFQDMTLQNNLTSTFLSAQQGMLSAVTPSIGGTILGGINNAAQAGAAGYTLGGGGAPKT